MTLTWRRGLFLRMAEHGPVTYALQTNWGDEGRTVHLTARAGGQNRRIGDAWPRVSDEDDERRARDLIALHHDSMLALASQASAAA